MGRKSPSSVRQTRVCPSCLREGRGLVGVTTAYQRVWHWWPRNDNCRQQHVCKPLTLPSFPLLPPIIPWGQKAAVRHPESSCLDIWGTSEGSLGRTAWESKEASFDRLKKKRWEENIKEKFTSSFKMINCSLEYILMHNSVFKVECGKWSFICFLCNIA